MKKSAALLWNASLVCLLAAAPAFAQPSGLRLETGTDGRPLHDSGNGLQLRFSTETAPTSGDLAATTPARNTLRANWPVLGYGLNTSVGLSWNALDASTQFSTNNIAPASFLGFGWRSEPLRNSRWNLSAEVGASIFGSGSCGSIGPVCPVSRPQGLSGDAVGNGLRLNPYISFGATLNY